MFYEWVWTCIENKPLLFAKACIACKKVRNCGGHVCTETHRHANYHTISGDQHWTSSIRSVQLNWNAEHIYFQMLTLSRIWGFAPTFKKRQPKYTFFYCKTCVVRTTSMFLVSQYSLILFNISDKRWKLHFAWRVDVAKSPFLGTWGFRFPNMAYRSFRSNSYTARPHLKNKRAMVKLYQGILFEMLGK